MIRMPNMDNLKELISAEAEKDSKQELKISTYGLRAQIRTNRTREKTQWATRSRFSRTKETVILNARGNFYGTTKRPSKFPKQQTLEKMTCAWLVATIFVTGVTRQWYSSSLEIVFKKHEDDEYRAGHQKLEIPHNKMLSIRHRIPKKGRRPKTEKRSHYKTTTIEITKVKISRIGRDNFSQKSSKLYESESRRSE